MPYSTRLLLCVRRELRLLDKLVCHAGYTDRVGEWQRLKLLRAYLVARVQRRLAGE